MSSKTQKISVKEFIDHHNPRLTRRGKKMSASYIYRLIRQHHQGERNDLWFDYAFDGEKDNISIIIKK